jgi:hypothetical protein
MGSDGLVGFKLTAGAHVLAAHRAARQARKFLEKEKHS